MLAGRFLVLLVLLVIRDVLHASTCSKIATRSISRESNDMNLTVAKKIVLLAGTALLGLALLTGIGQVELKKVYDTTNYANINTVPSFIDLQGALIPTLTNRTLLWQHIAQAENTGTAAIEAKIADNDKISKRIWLCMKKMVSAMTRTRSSSMSIALR